MPVSPVSNMSLFYNTAKPEVGLESEQYVPGTNSLNIVYGSSLSLVCRSRANDSSVTIRWLVQPEDGSEEPDELPSSENYNVFQNMTTSPDGNSASLLTIANAEYSDRAFYVCRADNEIATNDVRVLVRVKDRLAALYPFLGIVVEVTIIGVIIFVYEKQKSKSADNEDDLPTITR